MRQDLFHCKFNPVKAEQIRKWLSFSNTQKGATMHSKNKNLQGDSRDCVPVRVAVAGELVRLSDVIDAAEAAEEELGLGGLVDSADEELDPEQAAACGRSTPTLAIN